MIQHMYDEVGSVKATALINWHAWTGSDTTGHIQGNGKKGCFAVFQVSSPAVVGATSILGIR